jgi:hypothetical protein
MRSVWKSKSSFKWLFLAVDKPLQNAIFRVDTTDALSNMSKQNAKRLLKEVSVESNSGQEWSAELDSKSRVSFPGNDSEDDGGGGSRRRGREAGTPFSLAWLLTAFGFERRRLLEAVVQTYISLRSLVEGISDVRFHHESFIVLGRMRCSV